MRIQNNLDKAKLFAAMLAEAAKGLAGIDARFFGFTDETIFDAGSADRCAAHALETSGGNNDAAALWHAAEVARASRRSSRLLVMISDGSPTVCSTEALTALVAKLGRNDKINCAQVAVRALDHICFPHYIELLEGDFDTAVQSFGQIVARLVWKTLKG